MDIIGHNLIGPSNGANWERVRKSVVDSHRLVFLSLAAAARKSGLSGLMVCILWVGRMLA